MISSTTLPSADSLQGRPVPRVTVKTRAGSHWRDVTHHELVACIAIGQEP
jgi:glutathione-dependent peroxiredoxin